MIIGRVPPGCPRTTNSAPGSHGVRVGGERDRAPITRARRRRRRSEGEEKPSETPDNCGPGAGATLARTIWHYGTRRAAAAATAPAAPVDFSGRRTAYGAGSYEIGGGGSAIYPPVGTTTV